MFNHYQPREKEKRKKAKCLPNGRKGGGGFGDGKREKKGAIGRVSSFSKKSRERLKRGLRGKKID